MSFDIEKYEELELLYGPNIDDWPLSERIEGQKFAISADGQDYLQSRTGLNKLWQEADNILRRDEDAFLEKVSRIPLQYDQEIVRKPRGIQRFWQQVWDIKFLLSPKGFAVQAAMAVFIMACGVVIGAQAINDFTEYDDGLDISSEYFASYISEEDWSEEGIQ